MRGECTDLENPAPSAAYCQDSVDQAVAAARLSAVGVRATGPLEVLDAGLVLTPDDTWAEPPNAA